MDFFSKKMHVGRLLLKFLLLFRDFYGVNSSIVITLRIGVFLCYVE
jgi:hypothetical protein